MDEEGEYYEAMAGNAEDAYAMEMNVNKVYCGDSAELMKELPDNFIDLTVTSPPYDNLRDYHGYSFDFEAIAKELFRVTKQGGVVVWVVGDETKDFCESLSSFKQAIFFVEKCGFNLLDTMIYEKNGSPSPYPNMRRYALIFEYMFVFSKGKPKSFNPIKDRKNRTYGKVNSGNTARQKDGTTKQSGSYLQSKYSIRTNIWTYDVGKNKDTKDVIALKHPARFPEKLAKDHILSWSNVGDLVFDPFAGSGTTLKMAMLNERNYLGFEISAEYCDLIKSRLGGRLTGFFDTTDNNSYPASDEAQIPDGTSDSKSVKQNKSGVLQYSNRDSAEKDRESD